MNLSTADLRNYRTEFIYNSTKFQEILFCSSWDLPWTSSCFAERKNNNNNNNNKKNNNKKRSKMPGPLWIKLFAYILLWDQECVLSFTFLSLRPNQF
jgi:hypothetical protein